MKKTILILTIMVTFFTAQAQGEKKPTGVEINAGTMEMIHTGSIILALYLCILFLTTLIRTILEYRLKKMMIEKGAGEELSKDLLSSFRGDTKSEALKWCIVLIAAGAGLSLVKWFAPVGIHSIVIICFSLALGFFCYHFIQNKKKN